MYDPIILNSGDTMYEPMRGGRNVKKVKDEYVYSEVAFYAEMNKKINTTQQKKNKRKSCHKINYIQRDGDGPSCW